MLAQTKNQHSDVRPTVRFLVYEGQHLCLWFSAEREEGICSLLIVDKDVIAVLYGRRKTAAPRDLDYTTVSFSPTKLKLFPTVNALAAKDRNYFVMWNLETGKQIILESQDLVVNFEMDEEKG
jgi:hypothetical protein